MGLTSRPDIGIYSHAANLVGGLRFRLPQSGIVGCICNLVLKVPMLVFVKRLIILNRRCQLKEQNNPNESSANHQEELPMTPAKAAMCERLN